MEVGVVVKLVVEQVQHEHLDDAVLVIVGDVLGQLAEDGLQVKIEDDVEDQLEEDVAMVEVEQVEEFVEDQLEEYCVVVKVEDFVSNLLEEVKDLVAKHL